MSKLLLFLFLPLLATPVLAGDLLALGVRAGVPLTDAIGQASSPGFSFTDATRRFTIGPSAEILLPFGFGVEADILYRRTRMSVTSRQGGASLTEDQAVNVWEIPLIAKYRFPGLGLRPFVGAGGSYRSFGRFPTLVTNLKDSGWGFLLGAGLEIKIRRVRISPEIRFTRWGAGEKIGGSGLLQFQRNQLDALVGVTF